MVKIEIRWHGRGGQGAVTAAQVIAYAAISKGFYAQAFPEFGPERRGAPVKAYTRISDKPIRSREPIINPNYIVVLDSSLLRFSEVLSGISGDGYVIINSSTKPEINVKARLVWLDATNLALQVLGRPIVNTAMIGALLKVMTLLDVDCIFKALEHFFKGKILEKNVELVKRAYDEVKVEA